MKKDAQKDTREMDRIEDFADWTMTALQVVSIEPSSDKGKNLFTAIKRLENMMSRLKDLADDDMAVHTDNVASKTSKINYH
ncbi:MAG: hypothetical protein HQM16_14465 [Deltaproteobacteria bacterium]|nr:hypothetical protein [Deltaproteobacteria bacterium]